LRDQERDIDWRTLLLPGAGSRHQRSYLLRSAKALLLALIDTAASKGDLPAIGTVFGWLSLIRRLVHSMMKREVWLFADLRPDDMLDFLSAMRAVDGVSPASRRTVWNAARLFMRMWDLRALYAGSRRFNPNAFEIEIRQLAARGAVGRWQPLAEDQALRLVRGAIEWIGEFGGYAAELIHERCRLQPSPGQPTKHAIEKGQRMFNAAVELDPRLEKARVMLAMPEEHTSQVFHRLIRLTEGACVAVILFLTGIRSSELARLDVDRLREELRPDGGHDQFLVGVAAKRAGEGKRWVVCDPVPQAIGLLRTMYHDVRQEVGERALLLRRSGVLPRGEPGRRRSLAWAGHDVTGRLRAFAHGQDRREGRSVLRLHPHQARKTFARFVVLRDKTALGSLAYHFGHVYESVTDGSYVGHDIELAKLISSESRRELARCLTDLLSTTTMGGKAGTALSSRRRDLLEGSTFTGKRAVAEMVERLIDEGIELAPCNWGYCVYAKALSACSGDDKGPNPVRRAPDVCAACANFAVTERHRAWWEERVRRDEAFLQRPELGVQTVAVVRRRLEHASTVLQGLNRGARADLGKA
jgi:integrase